jgi:hypothetical protein
VKKPRYPITRSAEMQLAYAEVTMPRFHEMLGHAIEADRLPSADAQALVGAAQAVARDGSMPCSSSVVAIQQLRLQVNAGKLSMEELQAASDLLDAVEDAGGVPDLDGLIQVVAPAIQGAAFMDAVEQTIQEMGQGATPGDAAERFAKIEGLGKARVSMGSSLGFTLEDITASAVSTLKDPLPTGIDELDIALGGGVERSSLAVFLGNPGDGKSLCLCHVASESILNGHSVAYVTLELSEAQIKQRVYANVLNMTPQEMLDSPHEAVRRRMLLDSHVLHPLGSFRVLYMTPRMGTVAQMRQWLKDLERDFNEHPEVLIVDYADKLSSKVGSDKSSYTEQGTVYDQLRNLVVERDGWGWTASQATGRAGRKKKLDIEDIADSMEKARICDTLIAICRGEDDVQQGTVRFRLPKRRNGAAHAEVGPLVMDPEHGRMVTISRSEPW